MEQQELITNFFKFGTAVLVGFLIGTERSMEESTNPHATIRQFVIVALVGAISAYAAIQYDNSWLVFAGLLGILTLLVSGYWAEHQRHPKADLDLSTEGAALVTFFLGVMIVKDQAVLAIALAIVLLVILSERKLIKTFGKQIQKFELQATLKFLIITFIVLPILPRASLDESATAPIGTVTQSDAAAQVIEFEIAQGVAFEPGEKLSIYTKEEGSIGTFEVTGVENRVVTISFKGDRTAFETITPGTGLLQSYLPELINIMLSALKPFNIWMIVVLVSFIGFVGYVLIKVVGAGAGIGLTGLIGGLASSTVTTLSFSGRSKELPSLNQLFAVAIILASSVMFPRVVLQIGVFNPALMRNIALPMLITGGTGLALAAYLYWSAKKSASKSTAPSEEISFGNPFSLKSALTFGLVFATILVATRVATAYLGDAWLPAVALVSGLTDADAIAFSVSDLQRSGLISMDWASFNLVLGSLSNTYMKLFLVFSLGDRGLFKHCLVSFLIMGAAGIATMLLYYDIWGTGT
ncbi:MAG: MgtC/SapB family protein [Gammaproteobacteria bacterium]|nr:MgtC/SapB family protein [Gammaproteobacteria bacterium]